MNQTRTENQIIGAKSPYNFSETQAWKAMIALVIGFFMILMDSTIVSVAGPVIMEKLHADVTQIMWVNSAYLLTYAAPLLVTGRLGDRFGQRNIYLLGLILFTVASGLCGLAEFGPGTAINNLIMARALQGFAASLMTPQTMAVITRIFPPNRRGIAMGLWGATAGVAMLVGPILGGFLLGVLGWEWIFMINLPVGLIGFILAWLWVPKLEKHASGISPFSVLLSVIGMGLLVFGLQEGDTFHWGRIIGPITVPMLIISGLVIMAVFVFWQRRVAEPLMPLSLLKDRNFSLANTAIAMIGGAVMSWAVPLMFFLQISLGLSPLESALMGIPSAIFSVVFSPLVGKWVHRINPAYIAATGLGLAISALLLYFFTLPMFLPVAWYLVPNAILGLGMAGVWGPVSTGATANLAQAQAGAGAGVYNASRQLGTVLGNAATSAIMAVVLISWDPEDVAHGVAITLWYGIITLGIALIAVLAFEDMPTVRKH